MFHLLIDTCVWLDLAKDPKATPFLGVLEDLIKQGTVVLILPQIVVDEFTRNKSKIIKERAKSLTSHFSVVRAAAKASNLDAETINLFFSHLDEVNHKLPLSGGDAIGVLKRIEKLMLDTPIVFASNSAKMKALQRALDKKAPFHLGKNEMEDALMMEIYGETISNSKSRSRFAFITLNTEDFSGRGGDKRVFHEDFGDYFSPRKSLYFTSLQEALKRVAPSLVNESLMEEYGLEDTRTLSEILSAERFLCTQVWYNRHMICREEIQNGVIKVINFKEGEPDFSDRTMDKKIWRGALTAAKMVEKEYGKKNLGPWDAFEWGVINGKLSALRWILGDEWDMLDT